MQNKKNTIILSTAYLPPIEYILQFVLAEHIIIEQEETYSKQTYRNRCNIYGPNGLHTLSIPIIRPNGNHTKTKDILISYDTSWQSNHWRTLQAAYNASPFFMYYENKLAPFYTQQTKFLLEFNTNFLELILRFLKIKINITKSTEYKKVQLNSIDLRESIHPKKDKILISPRYTQVFEERYGFIPNLSILDLLCNKGPETIDYLKNITDPS